MKATSFVLCLFVALSFGALAQDAPTFDPKATAESLGLEPLQLPPNFYPNYPWEWAPKTFPQMTAEEYFQSVADCGYSGVGFTSPEHLPMCEKLGLKVIVSFGGLNLREDSGEVIDTKIKTIAEQTKNSPSVIGYYLIDEPGAKLFPALAQAVAAIKKHAPGKLAYINLFPSYASTDTVRNPNSQLQTKSFIEYLERYVQEVKPQFISYDNYMVEYSDDMHDPDKAAVYYADLLLVRSTALKYKLPWWNIVSSNRIQQQTPPPSPARFAFQTYTSLAAGAKGIGWFIYTHHESPQEKFSYSPIDTQGRKTLSWQYQQAVNKHIAVLGPIMNKLESTGVYFTSPAVERHPPKNYKGTPILPLPTLPGKIVESVTATASPRGIIKDVPPIMVGEFKGGDGDYVMFVNLSLEHSALLNLKTFKEYKQVEQFSPLDGSVSPLMVPDSGGAWLLPGHGVLARFKG